MTVIHLKSLGIIYCNHLLKMVNPADFSEMMFHDANTVTGGNFFSLINDIFQIFFSLISIC